ncbi:MAG: OmpA family protein, partial [Ekhidna sp.]
MSNLIVRPSLLASSIALAISTTTPVFAEQFCEETSACSSRDSAGRVSESNNQVLVKKQDNTEQNLADASWVFLGLPEIASQSQQGLPLEPKTLEMENLPQVHFSSGKHALDNELTSVFEQAIESLKGKKNVRLHFVGHADSQALSTRSHKIYESNVALSIARAKAVAEYFQQKLSLADTAITIEGKGSNEPLTSNLTEKDRAQNRRVELSAWFDDDVVIPKPMMSMMRNDVCQFTTTEARSM